MGYNYGISRINMGTHPYYTHAIVYHSVWCVTRHAQFNVNRWSYLMDLIFFCRVGARDQAGSSCQGRQDPVARAHLPVLSARQGVPNHRLLPGWQAEG